jgi:hypothetical protein
MGSVDRQGRIEAMLKSVGAVVESLCILAVHVTIYKQRRPCPIALGTNAERIRCVPSFRLQ